jgi:predicted O-methyltransferase YrrM
MEGVPRYSGSGAANDMRVGDTVSSRAVKLLVRARSRIRRGIANRTGLNLSRLALRERFETRFLKYIIRNRIRLVPERELENTYRDALLLLSKTRPPHQIGDYLEFGVYNGSSLVCMFRALDYLHIEQVRLFGFDSFQGLPRDALPGDEGTWLGGEFSSSQEFAQAVLTHEAVDLDRVWLVKGWFDEILTDRFKAKHELKKAGLIMIDCDIYSSAKEALRFCAPLIKDEAVVVFDDWGSGNLAERDLGEKRAFDEFLRDNPDLMAERLPDLRYTEASEVFLVKRTRHEDGAEAS